MNSFGFIVCHHTAPQTYLGGFSRLQLFTGLTSGYFIYIYMMSKNALTNNFLAISFCVYTIEKWLQTKLWEVAIIFVGLVVYDVYFVFGTDVMMTVAKGFDMPMKILIPTGAGKLSMIGIGDIIIPGLFISMCLRLDFIRSMIK